MRNLDSFKFGILKKKCLVKGNCSVIKAHKDLHAILCLLPVQLGGCTKGCCLLYSVMYLLSCMVIGPNQVLPPSTVAHYSMGLLLKPNLKIFYMLHSPVVKSQLDYVCMYVCENSPHHPHKLLLSKGNSGLYVFTKEEAEVCLLMALWFSFT